MTLIRTILAGLAVALLAGCSTTPTPVLPGGTAALLPGHTPTDSHKWQSKGEPPHELEADGTYRLSDEEMKLDCRRLTGRVQVGLAQHKGQASGPQTTGLARGLQGATAPLFQGSTVGTNPNAELARSRARLVAYNRRLADLKCKTFDIDAELAVPARRS